MKKIKLIFYQIWYGEKFQAGYSYKKLSSRNLSLLENMYDYWTNCKGYEKFSDIEMGFLEPYIWIRKKRNDGTTSNK